MPAVRAHQRLVEELPTSIPSICNREEWISEPGGLTQFGAFVHVLQSGTSSSIRHWHQAEDEFVYVLLGEVTVIEGDDEYVLHAGDAATFPSGVPIGHCLCNKSSAAAHCLIVGTRSRVDQVTYPDHDRVMRRDRAMPDDIWTDLTGMEADSPYKNWKP